MLSPDVELVDFDVRHLRNWYRLLLPPGVQDDPRWALVFVDGDRVVHAVVHPEGYVAPDRVPFTGTSRAALARLEAELDVSAVAVLEADALARFHADVDGELALDQDLVAQGLVMLRAAKRLSGAGLWTTPPVLDLVPQPRYESLQKTFDLLVPDRSALLAYIIDDDRHAVFASVIAGKSHGDIDLVTTHLAIADVIDERTLAASWRAQYKRVLQAVESRVARPSVGVFMERATYQRIVTGPPDQLARELNKKNVIIDPIPTWLMGLLGGATMAAFATRGARTLARFVPPSAKRLASEMAATANERMRETGMHPFALLGFDPIELWHELRTFYRR